MNKVKIYFRADGNSKIGLGHVIRSLALAEMLKDKFDCYFIIRNPLPTLRQQILAICKSIIELEEPEDDIQEAKSLCNKYFQGNEIVVLDGYHFVTDYQKEIKRKENRVVCIDDIHAFHFVADAIINHGGAIKKEDYSTEEYTKLFLGFSYALLRKPFRDAAKNKTTNLNKENNGKVFICLGGSDPDNTTQKVILNCLDKSPGKKYFVVVGGGYTYLDELNAALKNSSVKILHNISAEEMFQYMNMCDEAITSPSTISYEYLSVGGTLYLFQIADNQKDIINNFINEGLAYPLSDFGNQDKQKLDAGIFDGKQGKRFIRLFLSLALRLKPIDFNNHVNIIHGWINDKETRANSFSPEPIPFENHSNWLKRKTEDPNCLYFIFELEKSPCGQLRFDIENEIATISYLVAPEFRGMGLGYCILEKAIESLSNRKDIKTVVGFVKEENIASSKIFKTLGFSENKVDSSFKYSLKI